MPKKFQNIGSRRIYERTTTYKSKTMKKTSGSKPIIEGLKKKKSILETGSSSNLQGDQSPKTSIYNKIRPKIAGNMSPKSDGARTPTSNTTKSASVVKVTATRPNPVTTDKISKHAQRVK